MQADKLKNNLTRGETWVRGLYILLFAIAYTVAEIVLMVIVVFQFCSRLITRNTNARLLKLGQQLSTYAYQILTYVTFNSDERPYPFSAWPRGEPPRIKSTRAKPANKKSPGDD